MNPLCPICLASRDQFKSRCEQSTKLKLPINISLDCETYPHKNPNGV